MSTISSPLLWIPVLWILCFCACTVQKRPISKHKQPNSIQKKDPAKGKQTTKGNQMDKQHITAILNQFSPTEIGVLDEEMPRHLKPVLKKLVAASKIIDQLFLHQVHPQNSKWREEIAQNTSQGDVLALFDIMYGPWNRLDNNAIFWGTQKKPKGAGYYPFDLTKEELETWMAEHPNQKAAFKSYFTTVKRNDEGLVAVPYNVEYKKWLEPLSTVLKEAAALAEDPRLKKYLLSRAEAFLTNDYRPSDLDWMALGDGEIEVVIGPYEVYEDDIMGYKAAFESFVTLRNTADSKQLSKIKALMPKMEKALPIADEHKNLDRNFTSPISVVNVVYAAGDAKAGVQTLAFILPNDEFVRAQKGSKKVMLKNVAQAKFAKILMPIAQRLMHPAQVKHITFDAFFNHTLVHEIAHGLGPASISVNKDGEEVQSTPNKELKDLYSTIEECKADILGVYLNYLLVKEGLHDEGFIEQTHAALLSGFFRSVRFGGNEAHGKANIIQFNWLSKKQAVTFDGQKYSYQRDKMKDAIETLAHEVLMIEATGDYNRAQKLIEDFGQLPSHLQQSLSQLKNIPTDLKPIYTIEKHL